MSLQPFSITISAVTGDPNGLRIVEHSAWYGKALIFPRALLPKLVTSRDEFSRSAVYLLLGPSDDGDEVLYIGEADPVGERLQNHYANKDFWNRAIFFTGSNDQLNKTHVKFLEARLVQIAQSAKWIRLENRQNPTLPSQSESERIRSEGFLRHVLEVLPLLGVDAFEATRQADPTSLSIPQAESYGPRLVLRTRDIEAWATETSAGFVVEKGSTAMLEPTASMEAGVPAYFQLRATLIEQGVLAQAGDVFTFAQDFAFESPSAAAAIIHGRSANGRLEWKSEDGKTLKEIQTRASSRGVA